VRAHRRSIATNTAYSSFLRTNPSAAAQQQAQQELSHARTLPAAEKERVKSLIAEGKLAQVGRELFATQWKSTLPRKGAGGAKSPRSNSLAAQVAQQEAAAAEVAADEEEQAALMAALAMSMQEDDAAPPSAAGVAGAAGVWAGGEAAAAAAAGAAPPEEKKKKKKKKKKGGYASMMSGIMAPPAMTRTISAERRDHVEKIGKDLGGGAFTKLDKI
jgi:hypothetical protein